VYLTRSKILGIAEEIKQNCRWNNGQMRQGDIRTDSEVPGKQIYLGLSRPMFLLMVLPRGVVRGIICIIESVRCGSIQTLNNGEQSISACLPLETNQLWHSFLQRQANSAQLPMPLKHGELPSVSWMTRIRMSFL
jgi:hypothetical protein